MEEAGIEEREEGMDCLDEQMVRRETEWDGYKEER